LTKLKRDKRIIHTSKNYFHNKLAIRGLEDLAIRSRRFELDDQKKFKICLIGDAAAGKTCLLTRYLEDIFLENSRPTPGVNVKKKEEIVTISDKKGQKDHGRHHSRNFEYWDLGGQQLFEQLRTMYMKGADGIILCFNMNDERSFVANQSEHDHSVGKFLKEMISVFGSTDVKEIPIVLVGTKSDLEAKIDTRLIKSVVRKLRKAGMNIISYEKGMGSDVAVFGKHHLKFNRMWEAEKWQTGDGWVKTSSKVGNGVIDVFDVMKNILFEISTFNREEVKQRSSPRVSISGVRAMTDNPGGRYSYRPKKTAQKAASNPDPSKGRKTKRDLERVW